MLLKRLLLLRALCGLSGLADAQTITTFAGTGAAGGLLGTGGPATSAPLNAPVAVAVDPSGGVYVAEAGNRCVRRVDPTSGLISAFAGNGAAGYAGDGGYAVDASLSEPAGVVYDGAAGFIIADVGNGVLRRVNATSGRIETVPGGQPVGAPSGVAVLPPGAGTSSAAYLVVHSLAHIVQRVSATSGELQPFAGSRGSRGFAGDGSAATAALLSSPASAIPDSQGGVLIADSGNFCVRSVSTDGIITTVAGVGGTSGTAADGGRATASLLNAPFGLALDGSGGFLFTEVANSAVRWVLADGTLTTLAGCGHAGYSGDKGPAVLGCLAAPRGLAADPESGGYYVADTGNNVVRYVSSPLPSPSPSPSPPAVPSRVPRAPCSELAPPALPPPVPLDTSDAGLARAAADARLSAASQRRAALDGQMTCLLAHDADVSAAVDQLQGALIPDRTKEVTLAQKRLAALRDDHRGALSLRDERAAEVDALAQRLDALMAQADALRREQSNIVNAAMKGGAEARALSVKQTRLQLDVRSTVQRLEDLRARRDAEQESLAAAEMEARAGQEALAAEHADATAVSDSYAMRLRQAGAESAALAASKSSLDASTAADRAANVALVREVSETISRRDRVLARRDALRQQATILGLLVRGMNGTVADLLAEARDTLEMTNRTAGLLDQRRQDTADYAATTAKLKAETVAIQAGNRNISAAAAAVRPKLASLMALRDTAQRALEAMNAEVRSDNMDAEELANVRATLVGRLLELRATIAAARRAAAKASAELAQGQADEARVLEEAAQMRARASLLLVRIGEVQAARSQALIAARTRYLRRRGECQCDELRYAGASAAQLAACTRHCADATVVAGAVLLELSAPARDQQGAGSLPPRFAAARSADEVADEDGFAAEEDESRSPGADAALHLHRLDAALIDASVSSMGRVSGLVHDLGWGMGASTQAAGAQTAAGLSRFADLSLSADKPESSVRVHESAARLALSHIDAALVAADAQISRALHEDSLPTAAVVHRLRLEASTELLDAVADGTVALESAALQAPRRSDGAAAATAPRFRALTSAEADPVAAATMAKAADLEAAVADLQESISEKQGSLADKEVLLQRLRLELQQADADYAAAQQGIDERTLTLGSSADGNAERLDPVILSLESRRTALNTTVSALMASVLDLSARVALMRSAFADANAQLTRFKSGVNRLAAVLASLRREKAALTRALVATHFDAQQRRRETLTSASQLERERFESAQQARRLQQQLDEALREGAALDEYVKFMLEASQKLKAHIAELRTSKAGLAESESALSADMAVQAAALRSLAAQRDELMARNASLTVEIADLHQRLRATEDAIAAEDGANDAARAAAGSASVPRDNARTEEVRLREELVAVQRQRDTVMRQTLAVNASLAEASYELAQARELRTTLRLSALDANDTLAEGAGELRDALEAQARNETLLASMQQHLAASEEELRNLQLRAAHYAEAYERELRSQGLAPDYSVSGPALSSAVRDQRLRNIALKEEKAQAGLFSEGDSLPPPEVARAPTLATAAAAVSASRSP